MVFFYVKKNVFLVYPIMLFLCLCLCLWLCLCIGTDDGRMTLLRQSDNLLELSKTDRTGNSNGQWTMDIEREADAIKVFSCVSK